MAKAKRFNKSYAELSKEYGVKDSTLKFWAGKGHDLNSDSVIKGLISNSKHPTPTTQRQYKPRKLVLGSELGIGGSLERLRQTELELASSYQSALAAGSSDADVYRGQWLVCIEALRKAEVASPDVFEANKTSISIDVVRTWAVELTNDIRKALDAIPKRVTATMPDDIGKASYHQLRKEMDRIISKVHANRFFDIGGDGEE